MSLAASEWALQLPIIGGWKHVLIALAWHADEAGECHPGLERIALFAGMNEERSVRRCLRQLESIEAIKVVPSRGGRRASDYVLNVGMALPPGTPRSGPKMQQLRVNGHASYEPANTRSQSPGNNPVPRTPLKAIPGPTDPPKHPQYPVPESSLAVSKTAIPGPRVRNTRSQGPPNLHRKVERRESPTTTALEVAPREAAAAWTGDMKIVWEAWNAMAARSGLPQARDQTASRKRHLTVRLKELGLAAMLEAIERIGRSRFCQGGGKNGWRADFDFVLQAESLTAAREGRYDDRKPKATAWDLIDSFGRAPRSDDDWGTTIDGEAYDPTRTH